MKCAAEAQRRKNVEDPLYKKIFLENLARKQSLGQKVPIVYLGGASPGW